MKRSKAVASLCLAVGLVVGASRVDAEWAPKRAPIMTRFAADVRPDSVLPEYPRPQMERKDWQNLNGVWQYQAGKEGDATPVGQQLSGSILVPFCVESALSGVMEHHDRLWYRRTFSVPAGWNGKRVLLHFGAVDYETEVFVNGKSIGTHKGGYDPFTFDVTDSLKAGGGPQELIVRVFDPTDDGGQPRGKQSLHPGGIMYTPCSGIWQSVWMEPVAAGGIDSLKITPDVDGGTVKVTVNPLGDAGDAEATVTVKDGNTVVGTAKGKPGEVLSIPVPNAKLWSPDSPTLYDLSVSVAKNGTAVDEVGSYFGMRKIEIGDVDGVKKMLLNGKFVFEIGPLDQGFWPDGIYTAPTEAALKNDIQVMKDLGFNMVRKHIKVEPARWYYWTDHIGLLVWQDMPSPNSYTEHTPPVDKPEFKSELQRMVTGLYNVPSIIMWDTFNEGQAQHDTPELVQMVKEMDPTRLVNQASGGEHKGAGDVFDVHSYPPPGCPQPNPKMALACGEYGGIGRMVKGHLWAGTNGGYMNIDTPAELVDTYAEFTNMLKDFRDNRGLSAAVYTQITDVETELNGLLTYDRVPKMDIGLINKANHFQIGPPTFTIIVPTSEKEQQPWRYTTDAPAGDAWTKGTFDDKAWKEGKGGFGTRDTPGIGQLGTEWNTNDIWMRRTFNPGNVTPEQLANMPLRVYHDEDVEVYVNGVLAYRAKGFNGRYESVKMNEQAARSIKPNTDNVFAVHCKQTIGGQYVDVGIVRREPGAVK